jgi:hypothetical protein
MYSLAAGDNVSSQGRCENQFRMAHLTAKEH